MLERTICSFIPGIKCIHVTQNDIFMTFETWLTVTVPHKMDTVSIGFRDLV